LRGWLRTGEWVKEQQQREEEKDDDDNSTDDEGTFDEDESSANDHSTHISATSAYTGVDTSDQAFREIPSQGEIRTASTFADQQINGMHHL
jgi:hypothetical protein